jgi:hypothetical protein
MVGAGRGQLNRQPRGSGALKLFRVDPRHQPARSPSREDGSRLRDRECAAIAKHVAKFRQTSRGDGRNPPPRQKIHIGIRTAAIFRRHRVRAEKGRADINGLLLMQLVVNLQDFQLALPVQPVAALRFDRGGPVRREFVEVHSRPSLQLLCRSAPQPFDGGANSTTGTGDLLIRCPADSLVVFGCAATGKNQMGVRVNESRQDHAAMEVQLFRASRAAQPFDPPARTDRGNPVVANQQRAIADDPKFAEPTPAPRDGPAQRQEFGAAGNQPIWHGRRYDTSVTGSKKLLQRRAKPLLAWRIEAHFPVSARSLDDLRESRIATTQALTVFPRYTGAKTSATNDSSVVGVVFFGVRGSCGATSPAMPPFHISTISAAVLFGMPI